MPIATVFRAIFPCRVQDSSHLLRIWRLCCLTSSIGALFKSLLLASESMKYSSLDFSLPILAVCFGQLSAAIWATMPKATVNKHGDSLVDKSNVRLARDVLDVLFPSLQSHSRKHSAKAFFKPCAFAFDGLHCLPSVFRSEIVAHSLIRRVAHQATRAGTVASHSRPVGLGCAWQSKKSRARILRHQNP